MKFNIFKDEPKKTITKMNGKNTIYMHYAFTDLKGNRYYHYDNAEFDMNPARYAKRYILLVKEYFDGLHRKMLKSLFADILENKFKSKEQIIAAVYNANEYFKFDADLNLVYKINYFVYQITL